MTMSPPVQRTVALLTEAGYRLRETPTTVGSVPFDFAAMLVGADRALDLIVVVDTLLERGVRIRQKIEGLSRALDLVSSRRPLTAILVGPLPPSAILEALARVCRVLPVGTPAGDDSLADALAVLLPLQLPQTSDAANDPLGEMRNRLPTSVDRQMVDMLLGAAPSGASGVKETLRGILEEPLRQISEVDAK